jgi:UPF0716 protein FxsA
MGWFRKLVLVFTLVPLVEFLIFYFMAKIISFPLTIAIILVTGFIGAWLSKKQGFKALLSYQKAISEGRLPHREVIDGVLILLSGALLLTPGLLTDALGFAMLVPSIREKVRKFASDRIKGKISQAKEDLKKPQASSATTDVINVESEIIDDK